MSDPNPNAPENVRPETPEDVAALYSWANLQGGRYRDFSVARREYRAQQRHREEQGQAAEWHARATEDLKRAAEEAQRDLEEARRKADEQAARYAEAERRWSAEHARQWQELSGSVSDPGGATGHAAAAPEEEVIRPRRAASADRLRAAEDVPQAPAQAELPAAVAGQTDSAWENARRRRRSDSMPDFYTRTKRQPREEQPAGSAPERRTGRSLNTWERAAMARSSMDRNPHTPEWLGESREYRAQVDPVSPGYAPAAFSSGAGSGDVPPAEREADEAELRTDSGQGQREVEIRNSRSFSPVADTLQHSRERVAAQWYALRGLMGHAPEPAEAPVPTDLEREFNAPILIVTSLVGGVGKTSMVATLGRVLSSMGEKVLLADTAAHGVLPYFFGGREHRPEVVRTFSPPPGSSAAPVHMVNYGAERLLADDAGQAVLVEQLKCDAGEASRVLLDLSAGSMWMARRLSGLGPSILVPIAPDMNSVLSIRSMEQLRTGAVSGEAQALHPYYVLNQFDPSMPLHLDVREALRQQLGDRLLTWVVRRSPMVPEALAEGMTVVDYAPDAAVTEDFRRLADWLRQLAAPRAGIARNLRWSER